MVEIAILKLVAIKFRVYNCGGDYNIHYVISQTTDIPSKNMPALLKIYKLGTTKT